jgi:hypothetical protein
MKLVGLIKMCLNGTYSKVRIGQHLSGSFPIQNCLKQGDVLSPLIFKIGLQYAIKKVQGNQAKLIGSHQLLAFADDVNLLGDNIVTAKEKSNACGFLMGKPREKIPLGNSIRRWVGIIKMDPGEI